MKYYVFYRIKKPFHHILDSWNGTNLGLEKKIFIFGPFISYQISFHEDCQLRRQIQDC